MREKIEKEDWKGDVQEQFFGFSFSIYGKGICFFLIWWSCYKKLAKFKKVVLLAWLVLLGNSFDIDANKATSNPQKRRELF